MKTLKIIMICLCVLMLVICAISVYLSTTQEPSKFTKITGWACCGIWVISYLLLLLRKQ